MASDHNPYSPPAAMIGDVELPELRERPAAVIVAIVLIGIHTLLGVISHVRVFHVYLTASEVDQINLGIQIAKWLLLILICYQLWRGRNWARILLLVMTGFVLLSLFAQFWWLSNRPAGVDYQPDAMAFVRILLPSLIYLTASFLVFVPGRAWFSKRLRERPA